MQFKEINERQTDVIEHGIILGTVLIDPSGCRWSGNAAVLLTEYQLADIWTFMREQRERRKNGSLPKQE